MKKPLNNNPVPQKKLIQSPVFLFAMASLIAFVSFVAGTRIREWQSVLDPVLGINRSADTLDLSSVQNTYRYLAANFDGSIDKQALIDGANHGLVDAAGDKYTVYLNKQESDELKKDLSGDVGAGIGAEIGIRNKQPTITRLLNNNAAQKAGVKVGDVIVKVNGQSAKDWTADKAAKTIRGDVGTTVKITVSREGTESDYAITRAKINNPSVTSEIESGIGIMTISRFDEQTGSLARQAAEEFKRQNVKGVVVDVRSDGGGYLDAAVDVAGLWLENKVVVTQKSKGKVTNQEKTNSDAPLKGLKTIVLVNGGTASASEILSVALRDYDAAKLVGVKTFGKGSVQQVITLGTNDALLKVTIAKWYSPKDMNVNGKGLKPDYEVKLSDDDANAGRDPQLDRAKTLLVQ